MTAARDDVRSALITAGAKAIRDAMPEDPDSEDLQRVAAAFLDALPRSLLLRFAWPVGDELEAMVDAAARVLCAHENEADARVARLTGQREVPLVYEEWADDYNAVARAALDAALMTAEPVREGSENE